METESSRRIVLLKDVHGTWPIGHLTVARAGIYRPFLNPYGAVSVRAENGHLLGIKPGEFEWLDET